MVIYLSRIPSPLPELCIFFSLARKNERAQMDLQEKADQLKQSTLELSKLKSTAVHHLLLSSYSLFI